MSEVHPNIALLQRLDLRDLAASRHLFAKDVIWHYANPNLPELQGDYHGVDGVRTFFEAISATSGGSFEVHPVSATPVGNELVVVQSRNTLAFRGKPVAIDVVVVWRIVDGRIAEVWDIVPGDTREREHA
ncbi:nuclear transport factor 2 family protein [Primorskyibacter sp. S87]|uniref:nuclear transport factor 2 family protein n=1 Tax=Primorskyibacter sp. S87 TaxID=3415126 RepID=UPI003C7B274D